MPHNAEAPLPAAAVSVGAPTSNNLRARIEDRSAVVAVVGLGYVGLPLVRAFHDAGFSVIGYDVDARKLEMLSKGENYLRHLGDDLAATLARSHRFRPAMDDGDLSHADVVILCVPTPLGVHREPDLSFVHDSTRMVGRNLRKGQLVILESTTYPGTTRQELLPILEDEGGLECGADFFLAYSPEREDPGRADASTRSIPKLVGGIDDTSGDLAQALYAQAIDHVHRVATAEVAESAKLLENIYRAVNIALVNELKTVLAEMGIDIWAVIDAAATKPFGFQAFFPGPGLGGHCIPIDPFYLTWKAKEYGHHTKFIELAGEINSAMPGYVVSRIAAALNSQGKAIAGSRVMVLGIAYKPDIDDVRESPAAEIMALLGAMGAAVAYHDPYVPIFPSMRRYRFELSSVSLDPESLAGFDCVVIVTNHESVDYQSIGAHAQLIVDTRNAMARVENPAAVVVKA